MTLLDKWDDNTHWKSPQWLLIIGVLSLLTYAFGKVLLGDVAKPAELMLALSGLVAFCIWGKELRRNVLLLLGAVILVQLLSWGMGRLHHPEWTNASPSIDRLAKLFIFISIAWWLRGSTRNTLLIWSLATFGVLLATVINAPPGDGWIAGFSGERVGFGVRNQQHASMLFGVICIGLIIFAKRCVKPGRGQFIRMVTWLAALSMIIAGLAIGQTRAVWGGVFVALIVGLCSWCLYVLTRDGVRYLLKPLVVILLIVMAAATILYWSFGEVLHDRFEMEGQVIGQILHGDVSQVPYSSLGVRIHSWVAATQWIAERPWVGWGAEGRSLVMDETPWLPEWVAQEFGHLHNFFIEIWVGYGILGLLAITALACWIGYATWKAWRSGDMPGDMALFGTSFFAYWMIVNQMESYDSFWTGVYVHNLIVGGLITHYWKSCVINKD
ncbi:O-antigen ligase family protein [Cobetia sp. L2A1]|uniref:O-antigen ligase family protein n=1 Tax=Cobetia sp. L2A1 TaxID=2686360 RepID=UPI00131ACA27|nr:O-antigen ligase family protein [Cobetia sp. L2A1]